MVSVFKSLVVEFSFFSFEFCFDQVTILFLALFDGLAPLRPSFCLIFTSGFLSNLNLFWCRFGFGGHIVDMVFEAAAKGARNDPAKHIEECLSNEPDSIECMLRKVNVRQARAFCRERIGGSDPKD